MKILKNAVIVIIISAFLCSCGGGAKVLVVDDIEVYENHWQNAKDEVLKRASFDFNCPADQISLTLFQKVQAYPSEIGANGCNRRGMYIRIISHAGIGPWILNSESE